MATAFDAERSFPCYVITMKAYICVAKLLSNGAHRYPLGQIQRGKGDAHVFRGVFENEPQELEDDGAAGEAGEEDGRDQAPVAREQVGDVQLGQVEAHPARPQDDGARRQRVEAMGVGVAQQQEGRDVQKGPCRERAMPQTCSVRRP